MGSAAALSEFEQRIEQQFGLSRGVLLAVGLVCMALGLVSFMLPLSLFGSMIRLIGGLLIVSGAIKALQFLPGRRSAQTRRRSWPVIVIQVALDLLMGSLLINHLQASVGVVTAIFGLLFLVEGLLLLYMALRSPGVHSLLYLTLIGLVMAGCGTVILLRLVDDPLRWAGLFVGLKLVLFGGALTWIALRASRSDEALLYDAPKLAPVDGELYAVYFGTAFHLGVYIGDGEVVHYLNDNYVYRTTWEAFLDHRRPEHWTYPDLPPVPVEEVRKTALSEVGKMYPYNLLTFNCENFAVFCKSGGTTHTSKFAQIAGGVANVAAYPMLGMVAELNTRAVEWLAFHFGGPSGKRLSLAIRRIGAAITRWILTPARKPAPR